MIRGSLGAMEALRQHIRGRSASIGVLGLGPVGLTVAVALAHAGFRVRGVDRDLGRTAAVTQGRWPFPGLEPDLPQLLREVVGQGRLTAQTSPETLAVVEVALVAVDTPVAGARADLRSLTDACTTLAGALSPEALVIIESTVPPGTCGGVVSRLLGPSSGLRRPVGHCPERVMPGRLLANLRTMPRVCGGSTPEVAELLMELYGTFVDAPLSATDLVTAELVKTAENAVRDVNIAFANELARICEDAGGDFLEVRRLVNQCPGRDVLLAGAGVGGHCLPKDSWLLAQGAPEVVPQLLASARAVNDSMPGHMVELLRRGLRSARGSHEWPQVRVALLGTAYLEGTGDERNSPSLRAMEILRWHGVSVSVHDPWATARERDLWRVVEGADAAMVMVGHEEYRTLDLRRLRAALRTPVVVDGRQVIPPAAAAAAGLLLQSVGRGSAPSP